MDATAALSPPRRLQRLVLDAKSSPKRSASKRSVASKAACSRGCADAADDDSDDSDDASGKGGDEWDISRINRHWEIDAELRRSLPALARAKRGVNESAASKFLRLTKLPCPASSVSPSGMDDNNDSVDGAMHGRPLLRRLPTEAPTVTPEVKAKYFGGAASKAECFAIFRKLAAQKYLTNVPLSEFVEQQRQRQLAGGGEGRDSARWLLDSDDEAEDAKSKEREPSARQLSKSSSRHRQRKHHPHQTGDDAPCAVVPPLAVDLDRPTSIAMSTTTRTRRRDVPVEDANKHGLFSAQLTARHKFASLCLDRELPPCLRLIIRNYFAPEINVSHMAMGDDLAQVFAACLLDLPMVTGLNVRNNRLEDAGLRAIIDVIVAKRDMHHVDLSENKVDGAASAALASYLGSPSCSLQSLKLARADVDDGELAAFTRALHSNKSLLSLDVSNNLVGSSENLNVVRPSIITGGEALATMLSINHTLTSLDLSWNFLRLGGAIELGKALAYNSSLRELHLAYNAFGDAGAQAIGESLLANATLTTLDLAHNNIPAQGALTIANALKANSHAPLATLNVDGNPLGQTGGRAMLHAVAARPERKLHVSMEGCNFDLSSTDSFDPAEATGSYDLNMEVPYERAIALELLRVANNKQGCKFLSITHVTGKQRRVIKVELREIDGSDARRRLLKTAGIVTDVAIDTSRAKKYKVDRESLQAVFADLDEDGSGFIDEQELRLGLRKLQLPCQDEDIPRYIALYDVDGTGTIEFEEFAELIGSFHLETDHFPRHCVDVETNLPFEIPADGRLLIDFADFHVSADQDNAHSRAGVERLIENISASKNKGQMLGMAKSGLYFRANEAQLLLASVADAFEVAQAVMLLLPNMVDPKHAFTLIDQNLDAAQRVRVQHLMGSALPPILGLASGHYRLDLSLDMDRLTIKKLVENSNRTAFLRKKAGLKDTSQHGNYHGFRNETLNGKYVVLEPGFLDTMPKFGTLELDYVQTGRPTPACRPISTKRLEQVVGVCQLLQMGPPMGVRVGADKGSGTASRSRTTTSSPTSRTASSRTASGSRRPEASTPAPGSSTLDGGLELPYTTPYPPLRPFTNALFAELESMKTTPNYIKFGDGLNRAIELQPRVSVVSASTSGGLTHGATPVATPSPSDQRVAPPVVEEGDDEDDVEGEEGASEATSSSTDPNPSESPAPAPPAREACTARRLLFNLQWCLATHWITVQHAVALLALWPEPFASSRCDAVCVLFDRIVDLHNFSGVLAALTDAEAAQCLYRLGWLNLWTPLLPDNYYELDLTRYEEREVAKALVRLAIDEPGENWQGETFGWTRAEPIPGWELNMSWLKDGGFPEKGFLSLEYYSGADKGCGPVWPTRRELAAGTLCGLPDDAEQFALYVDSRSMMSRQRQRRESRVAAPAGT